MSQPQGQLATRRVNRKEAYGAAILGFILEPLWSDYDFAAPRRAQREEERRVRRGVGESQHCLNNEVECVDKFICLICVWHAIFKFAPSPKPATARVATHSFPPHSFSRSAYPRDAACCVERRISSTCCAMGSSMGNGSARNYAGLPSSGI